MLQLNVSKQASDQKLIKFVSKSIDNLPISLIHKLFRKKDIKVNGKWEKPEFIVSEGDIISIYIKEADLKSPKHINTNIELDILFENKDIMIVNKPAGLLSQGDKSGEKSLNDVIQSIIPSSPGFKASIANRLDRNTSGIVCIGKSYVGLKELGRIFKERLVSKYYLTVLQGRLEKENTYEMRLNRDKLKTIQKNDGKYTKTFIRPIDFLENSTLCEVQIFTGRTHQIRAVASEIGHPLLGDIKYGAKKNLKNYFLHCYKLEFSKECSCGLGSKVIESRLPKEFEFIWRNNGNLVNKRT